MAALRGFAIAAALAYASASAAASPVDRWSTHIAEASARFGLPATWIRNVLSAESGGQAVRDGRPILSRAGAMGLMQLMPGTWRDMRALLGLGFDPHDPRDNILAGAGYLRLMYDRFGYPGLFAAYHAGPARYARSLTGARALPVETRLYIAKVVGKERKERILAGAMTTGPRASLFAVSPAPRRSPATKALMVQRQGSLFVRLGSSSP